MTEEPKSGEWQRQSGQYQREQPPAPAGGLTNSLKFWLALIPVLSLALAFGGSYAGKAYKEGETQQKVLQLEANDKRQQEMLDKFYEKYVTQKYFDDKIDDLKDDRRQSEDRLMKRLDSISGDLGKRYSQR